MDNVTGVRVGKHIKLTVDAPDEAAATEQVEDMATRVLSNPVIEEFEVLEVREGVSSPRVGVITFPGSLDDADARRAVAAMGGDGRGTLARRGTISTTSTR